MKRDSRLSQALHLLLHINEFAEPVTSERLGEAMGLNPVIIRRSMAGLREAGLVESVKGHGGGWSTSRPLKSISLLDVYRALDEPILVHQHAGSENTPCIVERSIGRALSHTFAEAEALILKRFEKIKLSDLFEEFHEAMTKRKTATAKHVNGGCL